MLIILDSISVGSLYKKLKSAQQQTTIYCWHGFRTDEYISSHNLLH